MQSAKRNFINTKSHAFTEFGPRSLRFSSFKISKTAGLIETKLNIGVGSQSLFTGSGSHDHDGRHAHLWQKGFEIHLRN